MCVYVSLHNELHSTGFRFCTTLIGLILFFFSGVYKTVRVVVRVQHFNIHQILSEILRCTMCCWVTLYWCRAHYPVIEIKCVETKRTHNVIYMDTKAMCTNVWDLYDDATEEKQKQDKQTHEYQWIRCEKQMAAINAVHYYASNIEQ